MLKKVRGSAGNAEKLGTRFIKKYRLKIDF
jgi:hypothetical protein